MSRRRILNIVLVANGVVDHRLKEGLGALGGAICELDIENN